MRRVFQEGPNMVEKPVEIIGEIEAMALPLEALSRLFLLHRHIQEMLY